LKNKINILLGFIIFSGIYLQAQNNTYSPYSRYGLGELNPTTFAHNAGMGGAYIALKPDSLMPIFINTGNPAAYSLIRLTSLEVGGRYAYSNFTGTSSSLKKWNTNFSYAALGFPIRNNGGACIGIMPFTNVGYDLQTIIPESTIGDVTYLYSGTGGLNKVFAGYGVMPFNERLLKFRKKNQLNQDSLSKFQYKSKETISKILSDLSIGFNANYIFGSISQTARVVYPNSILYNNTYRERNINLGDFTGNFGIQTALTKDSIIDRKGKNKTVEREMASLKALGIFSDAALKIKRDSINASVPLRKKAMKEKVKITFGAFMALNNTIKANYDAAGYNYILNSGQEILRDTVFYQVNQKNTITLPLEQGLGIGFKKGERINIVADFAITDWQNFKFLDNLSTYSNSYRVALGVNYVPEKYAAGSRAFIKRINYRFGLNYNTGYIQVNNNAVISNYAITAGLGLPVGIGRLSSMINISAQYGFMGPPDNSSVKENYWRINFGFTFCDRWFQKFRYD